MTPAPPPPTHLPYGPELLEGLPGRARVDQYERVALGHGQPLHGRELVRPRRVGDLQRAYVLVAADHLPVRVLDGRYVRLAERALDEPQHQRALAHAARPENHHPVIVALFRHTGDVVLVLVVVRLITARTVYGSWSSPRATIAFSACNMII